MRERSTKGVDEVKFELNGFGVKIIANGRTLVSTKLTLTSEAQRVACVKSGNQIQEERLSSWSLIKFKPEPEYADQFIIEHIYNDKRPRLLCPQPDPNFWSTLTASNRVRDGYNSKANVIWKISEKPNPDKAAFNLKQQLKELRAVVADERLASMTS